jgi:flagellar motor switch protein FliN
MTTPANVSYDWVREIKPELKKLDSIPLTGAAPPFPWEDFSSRLAKALDCNDLIIHPGEIAWLSKEHLYEGLGDSPFPLIFTIPSLRGQVCWVMPAQEMDVLAALLLTKETHPLSFHDPDLSQSFYRFLALETLYHLTQVAYDKSLIPILTNQTTLPNEDSLCKDVSISLQGQTIWGRLIISPEFRSSWVEHFALKAEPSQLSTEMAQLIDIVVHLEAGKCQMTLKEWETVQLGDFILLDSCSLDSTRLDGRVMLTINGKQAFRAKLKDGTLKILELPLLHEVNAPMAKTPENEAEHEDEDDFSDLDLPENTDEHSDEHSEEEDLFEHETEDSLTEDDEEQTDAAHEGDGKEAAEKKGPVQPLSSKENHPAGPIVPEQIPLTLIVEVGQIQMNVDQLLKLEPGNLLEIDIHPENGVNLTIHGKVVGKGELIRIGDAIGVRVLELGR